MQGVGDEPANIVEPERGQHDLLDPCAGVADRLERSDERVRGADLVVPVCPDQQQVPHLRMRDQVLDEIERRGVQPLQIVEEQRERMLLAREHAEEAPENHLKAVPGVLRRQVRDRRLFPDHELQLGNEVDDELAVRAQRLAQGVPPPAKLRLALAEKGPHEAAEGLGQGGVRDVALVLVELARREQAARRDERLVEFVHHRRLADAGIAGDEHELGCAIRHDPVEGAEQRLDLVLPAVKLLRRHEQRSDTSSAPSGNGSMPRLRLPFRAGTSADRLRDPRRSGSGPRRSWRGASSRSPRAAPGCPRPARRAAPAGGRCGNAPIPSDRRRRRAVRR